MTFFETVHCGSGVHCHKCRDKEGGKKFRQSLKGKFGGINEVDFECPKGKGWTEPAKRLSFFSLLYEEVMEEGDEWLKTMARQCKEMYDNPPEGITCKSRREFRNRWYKKLKYYRKESQNEKAIA